MLTLDKVDLCVHDWRAGHCIDLLNPSRNWYTPTCRRCQWTPYPDTQVTIQCDDMPKIGRGNIKGPAC